MLRAISAFEASRRDFEDRTDSDLPTDAARWTLLAAFMERAARAPSEYSRRRALTRAATLLVDGGALRESRPTASTTSGALNLLSTPKSPRRFVRSQLIDAARHEAAAMEDAGALHLTFTFLESLRRIAADEGKRSEALVLVQQARAARHMGQLEVAQHLYDGAAAAGKATRDPELRARVALGRATLASIRGNYPLARRLYRHALGNAIRSERRDVASLANHGLMVTAAVGGDVATALSHGWDAFRDAAGEASREAEMLGNLAAICADNREYRGALHGYLAAAQRTSVARVVIPALAGAIRAAAYTGELGVIPALEHRLRALLDGIALPYECTRAFLLLAEAYVVLGRDGDACEARVRCEQDARRHGFFELLHRCGQLPTGAARAKARGHNPAVEDASSDKGALGDSATARRVLHELAVLGEPALARA
ncbi:MAG: hypothetical protein NVS4B3_11950 [Gemmatimonadaceae bacterium]